MAIFKTIILLLAYCLPLQVVSAQFGIYYDSKIGAVKYHKSLACPKNSQLTEAGTWQRRSGFYTVRNDINCCYLETTRNKCCESVTYNADTNEFTNVCKCDTTVVQCGSTSPIAPKSPTTREPTQQSSKPFCRSGGTHTLSSLTMGNRCGQYPGVFAIERSTSGTTVCNVVLLQTYVNGIDKVSLLTSKFCMETADAADKIHSLAIKVTSSLTIPYSTFVKIPGRDGAAFLESGTNTFKQLTSSCGLFACGLRLPEMTSRIDYDDCKVVTHGSDQSEASTLVNGGLMRSIDVRIEPMGCRNVKVKSATNTMCFTTKQQKPALCTEDYGAPVYCRSASTNEDIVIGIVAGSLDTCGTSNSFGVVRFPTY